MLNQNDEALEYSAPDDARSDAARDPIEAEGNGSQPANEHEPDARGFDDPMAQKVDSVGSLLRMVRRRHRLTIPDVEETTKIPKQYIAALEENDVSKFSNKTYALGFLRSYSMLLGLDAEECVRRFRVEFTDQRDSMGVRVAKREAAESAENASVRRPFGTLAIVGALLAVGWYASVDWIGVGYTSVSQEGTLAGSTPAEARTWESDHVATGGPQEIVELDKVPVGLNLLFGSSGTDQSDTNLMGTVSSRALNNLSRFGPGEVITGSDFADGASHGGVMFGGSFTRARIMLKSTDESWVRVETEDNVVLAQQTLDAGDSLVIPDAENITLSVRNAGGVELIVDGEVIGPLGQDGEVLLAVSLTPGQGRF